jgi:hypothetical protein
MILNKSARYHVMENIPLMTKFVGVR